MREAHKASKNNKHKNRGIMKTHKKRIIAISFCMAVIIATLLSCNKTKDIEISEKVADEALASKEGEFIFTDEQIQDLAKMHNYYLSQLLSTFNANCENPKDELLRCLLSLENVPTETLEEIAKKVETEELIVSMDDVIWYIWNSGLSHPEELESYVKTAEKHLNNPDLQYDMLLKQLDEIIQNYSDLDYQESVFLKAFVYIAEQSAYFWLPEEMGGSNQGAVLFDNPRSGLFGQIVLADAVSGATSFLCCWWLMTNPASLIGAGIGIAMASALSPLIDK